MLKLVNNSIYHIFELYNSDDKIILYVKLVNKDYQKDYINYRTDLLKLYNDTYKKLERKMFLIIDVNLIENKLMKIIKKELQFFKNNRGVLEFIIYKIYFLKESSFLTGILKMLTPFMIKSRVETIIKSNLEKSLEDILD